ncbi:MAG: outer membrane beta-barrel protein [Wenzhouxiangella sp.]|jgi:hypothetical protein|nr:outer membrane beta-barrel protein [Wenzhouxiangella sp.]
MSIRSMKRFSAATLLVALFFQVSPVNADGGWYLGASTGQSFIEVDLAGAGSAPLGFDERSTSWKGFGGYIIDLPLIDFGVEGSYVDFGSPSARFPGVEASVDVSGMNIWGIAGADLGPLGVYGKLGAIAWSLDGRTSGLVNQRIDESGTDIGYGIGAKFMLFSLEFRAEYERYDISEIDNLSMLSVGASWVF